MADRKGFRADSGWTNGYTASYGTGSGDGRNRPSVQKCRTLLDSIHEICLLHGYDISYYRQLFQMVESVIERIENDDMPYYLRFLEDTFPYMDKYHDLQGMKLVLNELSALKKLCRVIQEYNSDKTMDYASVQGSYGRYLSNHR